MMSIDNFLRQTARDYDMSYNDVLRIYNKWYSDGVFYEKLEEFIKDRSNN